MGKRKNSKINLIGLFKNKGEGQGMRKGSVVLMCLLVLGVFIAPRIGAETVSYDARGSLRAAEGYLNDDLSRMRNDGYLESVIVTDNVGLRRLQFSKSGSVVVFSAGKDTSTYVYDPEENELIQVSNIVYMGNKKLYAYTTMLDESDPENIVVLGSTITAFDSLGNAEFVITIDNNVPDFSRLMSDGDKLFKSLETLGVNLTIAGSEASGFKLTLGGSTELSVSVSDVKSLVKGYLDINKLIDNVASADYISTLVAIIPGAVFGEVETNSTEEQQRADVIAAFKEAGITLTEANFQDTSTLEGVLDGKITKANMKTIIAKLGDSTGLGVVLNQRIRQQLLAAIDKEFTVDQLFAMRDSGEDQNFIQDILINGVTEGSGGRQLLYSIGDLITAADLAIYNDTLPADKKLTAGEMETILNPVERIAAISKGYNNSVVPDISHLDILAMIEDMRSGKPLIYMDEAGNFLTPDTLTQEEIDLGITLQDKACSIAAMQRLSFDWLDLVDNDISRMEAKLNRFFGSPEELYEKWKGMTPDELATELANNPRGIAAMMSTTIGDEEYLLTSLPEGGLGEISASNVSQYGKLLCEKDRVGVLNRDLTAQDFIDARRCYIQNLKNIALKQGITAGATGVLNISTGLSDAYKGGTLNRLTVNGVYDNETINNLVGILLDAPDRAIDGDIKEQIAKWDINERRRFVQFFDKAVATAMVGADTFDFQGKTYSFLTGAYSPGGNTGLVTFGKEADDSEVTFRLTRSGQGESATIKINTVTDITAAAEKKTGMVQIDDQGTGDPDQGLFAYVTTSAWAVNLDVSEWISESSFYSRSVFAPLSSGFSIEGISISGLKGNINLSTQDATAFIPTEEVSITLNKVKAGNILKPDPAVTVNVTSVYTYDGSGNKLSLGAQDLNGYKSPDAGFNKIFLTSEVSEWSDIDNVMHIDQAYWDNVLTETQRQARRDHVEAAGGSIAFFTGGKMETDEDGQSSFKGMEVTIAVDLRRLEGKQREDAVVAVQNTLVDDSQELTLYGMINAEGDTITMLGLGIGQFEVHYYEQIS